MSENNEYTLRPLIADDLYPMCAILSKMGAEGFKNCLETPAVKEALSGGEWNVESVGVAVMADMAVTVLRHLPDCREDINRFLASLTGRKPEEIANMRLAPFARMVTELFQKEDFRDFFVAASELFRRENSAS